jgi:hypothetical protein
MQFNKCMRKGCHIYAIQVTNLLENENKPSLEDFVVLHDFRDVFVDEIHEFPPRRVMQEHHQHQVSQCGNKDSWTSASTNFLKNTLELLRKHKYGNLMKRTCIL